MPTSPVAPGSIESEFAGSTYTDRRLHQRVVKTAVALHRAPDQSFPKAMPDEAALEGFYRLVGNASVRPQDVLEGHVESTLQRAAGRDVLSIIDTTEFHFDEEREDLGWLPTGGYGFEMWAALLLTPEGFPLGVAAQQNLVRRHAPKRRKRAQTRRLQLEEKESVNWLEVAERVQQRVSAHVSSLVHVMDSETDNYQLLEAFVRKGMRFVVRAAYDRRVADEKGYETLEEKLESTEAAVFRSIPLSKRSPGPTSKKQRHPTRPAREASLHIRACAVRLRRPTSVPAEEKELVINVVRVFEPSPPEGEKPVEWTLYTTEPIDTPKALDRIVDIYCRRWVIEEFFKAVKTGCAFEERQLESQHALEVALSLFLPIAWHMLALRTIAHDAPAAPATTVLSTDHLEVLAALDRKFAIASATVAHVLAAIARLGGFISSNKVVGWQVLGRGYQSFQQAWLVWSLARSSREGPKK